MNRTSMTSSQRIAQADRRRGVTAAVVLVAIPVAAWLLYLDFVTWFAATETYASATIWAVFNTLFFLGLAMTVFGYLEANPWVPAAWSAVITMAACAAVYSAITLALIGIDWSNGWSTGYFAWHDRCVASNAHVVETDGEHLCVGQDGRVQNSIPAPVILVGPTNNL